MVATGVMLSPWDFEEWAAAVGVTPDMVMLFESWGLQRVPWAHLSRVAQLGMRTHMTTWEPWGQGYRPDQHSGTTIDFSCDAIASGAHDEYIREFARAVKDSGITTEYLRFGHEMQGAWYPWSADPAAYVAAWRRVHWQLRAVGADNIQMVWSPNGDLYRSFDRFLAAVMPYWPGGEYVQHVGVTAINFGGAKERPASAFGQRALGLGRTLGKTIVLPEINTAHEGRQAWLQEMATWCSKNTRDLRMVCLSQPAVSNGQASIPDVGWMQWRVEADPVAADVVRGWFRRMSSVSAG